MAADEYIDYDSDYDAKAEAGRGVTANVDPYAGKFGNKHTRNFVVTTVVATLTFLQAFFSQRIAVKQSLK